jgi:hypothetical protein
LVDSSSVAPPPRLKLAKPVGASAIADILTPNPHHLRIKKLSAGAALPDGEGAGWAAVQGHAEGSLAAQVGHLDQLAATCFKPTAGDAQEGEVIQCQTMRHLLRP